MVLVGSQEVKKGTTFDKLKNGELSLFNYPAP
jgi:hypothetical protein